MCHNVPWLSELDKQMRLQFAPKESKAESYQSSGGRAFHTLGPAAVFLPPMPGHVLIAE